MTRKNFTADFKSKVAIEALKGHRTIGELSSEFGVHATQDEAERENLYSQIGRLKVELDWLKKKTGYAH